ncbi:tripartite tricarboxylate transporter substrate binding protein [Allopusillimonas soli]|uniref:Tripartite tricarboxylate transporter substrate binding protein n=1 Tax=Allopusillimonas soli TaxID=659016 RepID=A0A853F4C4_9BURK|nr:tripartite tricarboxylate transporter substrate binding protein [Allopusillimonas soli]NYT35354.1 tripartite tricarboxylate transporter substrate binding protein [Allopusillimonas soli]TEA75774.1 tripartite tricarboxylate transporter substrate binding protein [Allopusillimonas soli]
MRIISKIAVALSILTMPVASGISAAHAQGESFPTKAIHIVVPFSPGGAVDMLGRLIATHLSQQMHQSVIVENRPGANGNLGTEYVVKSAPDGYTLLLGSNGMASNGLVYSHRSFNELKDLTAIGYIGSAPLIMVVGKNYPADSAGEIIAKAKSDPTSVSYASAGFGSSANLASEALKFAAKVDILHVPYKGGAPAIVDLSTGRVSFMMLDPLQAMPQIKSDRLRALMIGTNDHLSLLPNVQTAGEAGYPDLNATVWWGLVAPVGTPPDVVRKLNAELNTVLNNADVKNQLISLGVTLQPGTPEQFDKYIHAQVEKWAPIVKAAGIKAD